jgi:hypothetical protein
MILKPTLVPTPAQPSLRNHQDGYANVKSITDEEKWQRLCINTPLVPTSAEYVKNLTTINIPPKNIADEEK